MNPFAYLRSLIPERKAPSMPTKPAPVRLRYMTEADASAFGFLGDYEFWMHEFPALLSSALCVVAEREGQPAGYVIMEPYEGFWLLTGIEAGEGGELSDDLGWFMLSRLDESRPYVESWARDPERGDRLRRIGFTATGLAPGREWFVFRLSSDLFGPVRPRGPIDEPHGRS